MTVCSYCTSNVSEAETVCPVCNYPLQGTEKEKAQFVARQVIQKSEVLDSIEKLKRARILLFVLGGFYALAGLYLLSKPGGIVNAISGAFLGFMCVGFGFLTFKHPKIALLIPLIAAVLYYIGLGIYDPMLLFRGMLWKILVMIGLSYGYFSVLNADKILKANPYMAQKLGFTKIEDK